MATENIGYSLRSMCNNDYLSKEENYELIKKIQQGDNSAKDLFIRHNGRLVLKTIKMYFPKYIDDDDIFQQGVMGLLKAAEMFDLSLNLSITTYCTYWIRNLIGRYVVDYTQPVHIPYNKQPLLAKIRHLISSYDADTSEYDLLEYICNGTDTTKDVILELLPYCTNTVSLNQTIEVDESGDTELLDFVKDDTVSVEDDILNEQLSNAVVSVMDKILSDREMYVLKCRYGFLNNRIMTLQEVGEELGLSRERVRQIEVRAIKKLRKSPKVKNLLGYIKE